MKVKTIIIFGKPGDWNTSASIEVPGLGDVKIERCFSEETINRLCQEAEIALRLKMGQKEVCDEKSGQPQVDSSS